MVYSADFSPIRITGTDPVAPVQPPSIDIPPPPEPAYQSGQLPGLQPDDSGMQVAANISQGFDIKKQAMQAVTQAKLQGIAAEQDTLRVQRESINRSVSAIPGTSLFAQNLAGIQQGLLRTEQIRNMELERVAKEREAHQDQRAAQANIESNLLLFKAQDIIDAAPEVGMQQAQQMVLDFLSKYPDLKPADATSIANRVFHALGETRNTWSQRTHEELKKISNTRTDQAKATVSLEGAGILVGLGNSEDPEERSRLLTQFFDLTESTAQRFGLTPIEAAELQVHSLEASAKDTTLGFKAQQELQKALDNTKAFYSQAQDLAYRKDLPEDDPNYINPAQYKQGLAELRAIYRMPESASPVTIDDMKRELKDRLSTDAAIEGLIEDDAIDARNAAGVQMIEVGETVWDLVNGRGKGIGYYKRMAKQGDDTAVTIVEFYDTFQQNRNKRQSLQKERVNLQSQLATAQDRLYRTTNKGEIVGFQGEVDAVQARMDELDRQMMGLDNDLAPIYLDDMSNPNNSSLSRAQKQYAPIRDRIKQEKLRQGPNQDF